MQELQNKITPATQNITNQANTAAAPMVPGYTTGLFESLFNIEACLCTCFCFCIPLGIAKANLDGRDVKFLDFLCCSNPWQLRQQLRSKFGMQYAGPQDCLVLLFCAHCGLCQDTVEVSKRTGKPLQWWDIPNDL